MKKVKKVWERGYHAFPPHCTPGRHTPEVFVNGTFKIAILHIFLFTHFFYLVIS